MAVSILLGVGATATWAILTPSPRALGAIADRSPARENLNTTTTHGFVIDHTSVELFEHIPPEYLALARDKSLLYMGNAPGRDIDNALNCLTADSWETSDVLCRRDYIDSSVDWSWKPFAVTDTAPARIWFEPDANVYRRDNWTYVENYHTWSDATRHFIQVVGPANIDSNDVLSFFFGYLTIGDASALLNPYIGFFVDNPYTFGIHDLEAYMAQHTDKEFVLWTSSLSREHGSQTSTDFNNQLRQYAIANDMILFDLADIESFTIDEQGDPAQCYDNRDGVPYCRWAGQIVTNDCEDEPVEVPPLDLPAICQDYTTQTYGGPLGSVSAGKLRVAKAMWVLMARIAGWDGVVDGEPPPDPTDTPVFTNTPTPPTPTPTDTPSSGSTPTDTPAPGSTPTDTPPPGSTPTDTPPPGSTPTDTPPPGSTPTNTPPPGSTPTPGGTVTGTPPASTTPNPTTEPAGDGDVYLPSLFGGN